MSISTDVHWPYMCDPLGLYILPINNSIDLITLIVLLTIIHINIFINFIKDWFNLIDKLSYQPIGWQAISRALGNIEYMRTLSWNLPS